MTQQLLLFLVDALSFEYLKWMPHLQGLADHGGKAYSVKPAAGFRGVEPALNGEWTLPEEVPFRFRRKSDEPTRFPPMLGFGDMFFPSSFNRIYRLFLSRLFKTSYPHLIPRSLLRELEVSSGTSRIPLAIEQWEEQGKNVWWFTRDSDWEGKKSLTARVYRKVYRPLMLEEALDALSEGNEVVYLEFSTLLDDVGHRYGPHSNEMEHTCREFDRELFEWLAKARVRASGEISVGIISDHGMSEVTGFVDLERILELKDMVNGRDYLGIWNSNFAQVWPMDSSIGKFQESVSAVPQIALLSEDERERWFGQDRTYGERILAAEEGMVIHPNHFQGNKRVKGMHGYLNAESSESRALAVFSGPVFDVLEEELIEMPELHRLLTTR